MSMSLFFVAEICKKSFIISPKILRVKISSSIFSESRNVLRKTIFSTQVQIKDVTEEGDSSPTFG